MRDTEIEWMSVKQAADEMHCLVATICRNNGKNGFPRLYKVCGRLMLKRSDWRNYLAAPPLARNRLMESRSRAL